MSRPPANQNLVALVATRKGVWFFHSDTRRRKWATSGPHFLGHTISYRRRPRSRAEP